MYLFSNHNLTSENIPNVLKSKLDVNSNHRHNCIPNSCNLRRFKRKWLACFTILKPNQNSDFKSYI